MLSEDLVDEIQRMLAAGHSRREVIRITGASRTTVDRIADGQRSTEPSSLYRRITPKRCPDCGGMVYPPCKLCGTRTKLANRR
jgi:hypothetical protein